MPTRFHAVSISNTAPRFAGTAVVWSAAYATPAEARREGKRLVRAGEATLAFLVELDGRQGHVRETYPAPADAVVRHYLSVIEAVKERT